jgi:uncharacterized protein (DUF2336 family)
MASVETGAAQQLIELARSKSAAARSELAAAMSDLFFDDRQVLSERERALMGSILREVLHEVELAVRHRLAERLGAQPSAPRELVVALANDVIEVARPILERSEALQDDDLIEIILHRTREHQLSIALRRSLGEAVSEALVETGDADVITRLLGNPGAQISRRTMEYLVDQSKHVDSFQNPLLHREDLGPELARRMYFWVSAALRKHILEHYEIDPVELDESLEDSVHDLLGAVPADPSIRRGAAELAALLREQGMGTPALLLRVLDAGEISLFIALLARMTGLSGTMIRRLLMEKSGEALAVIARALEIEREDFAALFTALARVRPGDAAGRERALLNALTYYDSYRSEAARQALRSWRRSPDFLAAIQRVDTPLRRPTRH